MLADLGLGGFQFFFQFDDDEVNGRVDESVAQRIGRRDLRGLQFGNL